MLNFEELDHEFMTEGNPAADAENIAGLIQQNLTPEEQDRLKEMMPVLEEYNMLMVKVHTGKSVEELEKSGELEAFGVPMEEGSDRGVPQEDQMQQRPPPQAVQGQVPQNAPEMMSKGGTVTYGGGYDVDISDIVNSKNAPTWLQRALDPSTPTTEDNETIRSVHEKVDGNWVIYPSIRMIDGKLKKFEGKEIDKAYNMAIDKNDYIVVPARNSEEAKAYSIAISDEISKRRNPKGMPQMAIGGVPPVIQENVEPMGNPGDVAAGPVGLVNDPGADKSGVGDDVQAKSDGFVINAAAVKHAGLKDINDMIQGAKEYAEQKGIKLNFGKTPTGAEDILVSNGEVVVPDALANIIGYDKLEKINNRGKKETEEKLVAQKGEAPPEGPPPSAAPPPPPVLQDQMSGLT